MPVDDKAKSRSVSFKPRLWALVDQVVERHFDGDRSAYFQRLVNADLVKNSAGMTYSRVVGDPMAIPPAMQDIVMSQLAEMRTAIASLADDLAAKHRR